MGKTTDLTKKIRGTQGTSHAKMGIIKDRNCMYPTEAEDIKKKWQEHTNGKLSYVSFMRVWWFWTVSI